MDNKQMDVFIERLMYDFDTIRYLIDYRRVNDTVPILNRIIVSMQSFQRIFGGNNELFKDVFSDAYWKAGFKGVLTNEDMCLKVRNYSYTAEGFVDGDLKKSEYLDFINKLEEWAYENKRILRNRLKTPLQRRCERIAVSFFVMLIALVCIGFLINGFYTREWGLTGSIYQGINFNKKIAEMRDKEINFSNCSQISNGRLTDNLSARWTGVLIIPQSGMYTFNVAADDGVRLKINEDWLINSWRRQVAEFSKEIYLDQGEHQLVLDYFSPDQGCRLELYWTMPKGKKEIISSRFLRKR